MLSPEKIELFKEDYSYSKPMSGFVKIELKSNEEDNDINLLKNSNIDKEEIKMNTLELEKKDSNDDIPDEFNKNKDKDNDENIPEDKNDSPKQNFLQVKNIIIKNQMNNSPNSNEYCNF